MSFSDIPTKSGYHPQGNGQDEEGPPEHPGLTQQGFQTLFAAFGGPSGPSLASSEQTNTLCAHQTDSFSLSGLGSSGGRDIDNYPCPNTINDMSMGIICNTVSGSFMSGNNTISDFVGQKQQPAQASVESLQWQPSVTSAAGNSTALNMTPQDFLAGPAVQNSRQMACGVTCLPQEVAVGQETPTPCFTVEEEREELATLTIEEIIRVEKDLRGVQANLGGMTLEDDKQQSSVQPVQPVQPVTKKKKTRGRGAPPPPPTPPDDAVEATDSDILRLDAELDRIDPSIKAAYLQACIQCPAEVQNRDRKAAFLEREDLNAPRAALRLVAYWQLRLNTFGPDRAFLPMTIDGAIRDDVADMIQHCVIHVLPYTDTSGRAIVFYDPSKRNLQQFPLDREGRALFYLFDSLTTDPTIRRAGFIGVANYRNVGRSQISAKQQRHMRSLFEVMPTRIRSCHICHPSTVMTYAYPVLKYILGRNIRLRTRLHSGMDQNVLDQLAACSLPRHCLPRELGGHLTLNFAQWVANRSIVETSMALTDENGRHSDLDENDAKISIVLDNILLQDLGGNPSPTSEKQQFSNSEKVADGQPLLTGDEARRAVVGRFTDELMAIGEATGMRKQPAKAGWKDAPGHISSSFSEDIGLEEG